MRKYIKGFGIWGIRIESFYWYNNIDDNIRIWNVVLSWIMYVFLILYIYICIFEMIFWVVKIFL